MRRFMTWAAIACIGCTVTTTAIAEVATTYEANAQTQLDSQRPRGRGQNGGRMSMVKPQQYAQDRLDAIAKAAELTEEEKAIVGAELKRYDDIRVQTWVETRKVYDEMTQLGDRAADKDYRDSIQKLVDLSAKRQKANQDFITLLTQKLSPKKAYLVHRSYKRFNAYTARKLRQ
ncbi:hypothetical protein IX336_000761 [Porphyromonas levii]|uniref:hypothetical protein n=1 Tax=Porphyromonas levii TaxID=28114 RepID=UPI001BA4F17F|nr:hypothetical protein [Porphyromonas levii]MBR8765399.1 hypothetical protein [Porphyromonas levii]